LRNFNLFRLEATYEIREDIADVLGRVGGVADSDEVKTALLGVMLIVWYGQLQPCEVERRCASVAI
jgi:hypothetical protein